MRLTGHALGEFQKWYLKHTERDKEYFPRFLEAPIMFQWGVYQDWADSLGYHMNIECSLGAGPPLHYFCITWRNKDFVDEFVDNHNLQEQPSETRQEARNAAIEKLNELINQKQIR